LNHNDAFHIGSVLKNNYHLQLLDISNNNIQDDGFRHIAEALGYQSVHVNKSGSGDSLLSASKFDFSDLTANLNNINNNRRRFCTTPPPKIQVADDGACSINNNSILHCDNDDKGGEPESAKTEETEESDVKSKSGSESAAVAMISTNSQKTEDASMKDKFKYTTASLSPISHGYDDTSTNHQIFNARSPERSFSSESLCSETSIESNDSKSSIRLIETKFSNNRNGTLERQSSHVPRTLEGSEKQLTGLQVLILWNNNMTKRCSPSAADLLECTENLQIINFGQNPIGNEFLLEVKSSLKTNKSLTSLGLQATDITCEGLKTLSETLQFGGNSTLQRIDLRNNDLSIMGLSSLSEALKSNKSIIRVDLDESPKCGMLPMYENNSEYQRWISTIRQQCAHNENPPEPQEAAKATTTVQRMKRSHLTGRKISLTCSSVQVTPKQMLDPMKKTAVSSRLRSPSPIPSPVSSPLPSPSRSRFQVSRVSESSSGVSSKLASSTSPSPSSSSGSPTFFPSSTSRFRVSSVAEPPKRFMVSPVTPVESPSLSKLVMSETKLEQSKEIDIPIKASMSAPAKFVPQANFLNISNSSLLSSQSCEQLDYEIKRYVDMDSCSSFSSSIDSIDHPTDMSSTESFDMIENKPPQIIEPLKIVEAERKEILTEPDDDRKEIFSNENTLVSTSSSSSSNEGLTLTTNSPTSELSPKQDAQKRVRKTSWIQNAIGVSGKSENYPATLDKLINLFHNPASIFTKSSPESTLASSPSGPQAKPKTAQIKDEKPMQKESSFSGFINSIVSLTHKKDEKMTSGDSTTILQNISPENTVGKASLSSQMALEPLPKSVQQEVKENISPENTISCDNFAEIERYRGSAARVLFMVGSESNLDLVDTQDEVSTNDSSIDDVFPGVGSLSENSCDSLSMKAKSDELETAQGVEDKT
jgi:Leucine Rich repeat